MTFYETIAACIRDVTEHGFDSEFRLQYWLDEIREAALRALTPEHVLQEALQRTLQTVFRRLVEKKGVLKRMPGVSKFTVDQVAPQCRLLLNQKLFASANLIKLNRTEMIEKTLRRLAGWITSIPAGGSDAVPHRQTKNEVYKTLRSLPFVERRVLIDQANKLTNSIHETVAIAGGAIAYEWHSHWREPGYDYRPDHKERDRKVYAIRDSWAAERGFINEGDGWTDEMTQPGEEVFCRCWTRYIFNLRDVPANMLTDDGVIELARVRAELQARRQAIQERKAA
jgi:hypothetical protein